MKTCVAQIQPRGRFTVKENSHSYVVAVPLVRVKERSMTVFDRLVFSNCPYYSQQCRFKLHSWPLDPRLFPYRKWLFLILFHNLPNSFHRNPAPLQALDTAIAKLCSELLCRTYLCGEWQRLTASSLAQTPTASSLKPWHISELWSWTGNNRVLSLLSG